MDIRKNYDIFDLTKLVLCLFIISIHSGMAKGILSPCVRIAVPLFFMISSYLFFERKYEITDISCSKEMIYKFVKRNLKLYVFWSIILLPLTTIYDIHKNFISEEKSSLWMIIINSFRKILFGAFPASWYIVASIIAIFILGHIPKKYNKIMIIISFFLYLICCISSNYYNLFDVDSGIIKFIKIFELLFNIPCNSFLVAFIWMGIGKIYAENKIVISSIVGRIGIVLSAILIYVEYYVIKIFSLSNADDCYILLIPLCFFIFNELKKIENLKLKNALTIRKSSTIVYCSHISVLRIYTFVLENILHCQIHILFFIATVITCIIICYFVFKFEKKKYFKWLKYSY